MKDIAVLQFGHRNTFPNKVRVGNTIYENIVSHVEEHLYKWRGSKAKLMGIDWRCHLEDGGVLYLRELYKGKKSAWTLLRRKYAKRVKKQQSGK